MGFFDNKTVTLFIRAFDPETEKEKYYPTLLEGVDLVETKGANVSKSGIDSADAVKLYIDFVDVNKTFKPYLPPKAWDALPEEEKQNYITFHPTEDFLPRETVQMWNCRKNMRMSGYRRTSMMFIRSRP